MAYIGILRNVLYQSNTTFTRDSGEVFLDRVSSKKIYFSNQQNLSEPFMIPNNVVTLTAFRKQINLEPIAPILL